MPTTIKHPLTLNLGGISVELQRFTDDAYPRTTIQQATLEFSINGTPALGGSAFAPKYLWNISAIINREQRALIEAIATEFHERRRNLINADILLFDTTAPVVEKPGRSQVPGMPTAAVAGGYLSFYGQFKAAITENPKFAKQGVYDTVSLILTETIFT